VICISRTENKEIRNKSIKENLSYDFIPFDLSNYNNIDKLGEQIFEKINEDESELICLINNAAVVTPLGGIDECRAQDIRNDKRLEYEKNHH
jgi:benzil reductase ((S)-benzoin forming)